LLNCVSSKPGAGQLANTTPGSPLPIALPAAPAAVKKSFGSYKRESQWQCDQVNDCSVRRYSSSFASSRNRAGIILYQYTATARLNTAAPKDASALITLSFKNLSDSYPKEDKWQRYPNEIAQSRQKARRNFQFSHWFPTSRARSTKSQGLQAPRPYQRPCREALRGAASRFRKKLEEEWLSSETREHSLAAALCAGQLRVRPRMESGLPFVTFPLRS
jgi:hypothetical protein